jgi:Ca2+-binding RTX toxin-like protein
VVGAGNLNLTDLEYFAGRLLLDNGANRLDFGVTGNSVRVLGGSAGDWIAAGRGGSSIDGALGNDSLYGGIGGDTLLGGGGNDLLYGSRTQSTRDGNDRLDGGAGNDTMFGGFGGDTYVVDSLGDVVREFENEGRDRVEASLSWTLGLNLEDLTLTGVAALNGTGNALNNEISGNSGANSLLGGAGNDRLWGEGGKDTMRGGVGNDTLYAHNNGDLVAGEIYDGGAGTDRISIDGGSVASLVGITVVGIEELWSNASSTRLTASLLDVFTYVNTNGVEVMTGGAIDLTNLTFLYSGATFRLAAAGNTIDFSGLGTGTKVFGSTVSGADVILGSNGACSLDGGVGADSIVGGSAADTLVGGAGADTLTGGGGADRFVWADATHGGDTLTDFSAAAGDKLVFQGLLKGGFVYLGAGAFTGGSNNSEARFAGVGVLQVDTDGDGAANITLTIATLANAGQIGAADFVWS